VADGQGRGLGVLAGERHDLGESLGREGGGSAGAGFVGKDRLDEPEQVEVGGAFCLGRFEAVGCLGPPLAPGAGGLPMEVQLISDRIVGQAIGGKADDLKATEQLLGRVLAASQVVQQLPLALCQLDGKRTWARHRIDSFHEQSTGAIRPSVPKYIPSSLRRRISAAMY
jgi:hypothetical protein